jgi:hypothetical protein
LGDADGPITAAGAYQSFQFANLNGPSWAELLIWVGNDPGVNVYRYTPGSGNPWVYAGSGSTGCTLRVGQAIFQNQGGWNFQVNQLDALNIGVEIGNQSRVTGVDKEPTLRLGGRALTRNVLDLRSVKVTVHRRLREVRGGAELVKDHNGGDFGAIIPQRQPHVTAKQAAFATRPGETPRLWLELKAQPKQNELEVDLAVEQLVVASPQLCVDDPPTTRLHLELELKTGDLPVPLTLAQVQDWACVTRRAGTLWQLRPAGNPAVVIK